MHVWLCIFMAFLPALVATEQPDQFCDVGRCTADTTTKSEELLCMDEQFPIEDSGEEEVEAAMQCLPLLRHKLATCSERVQQLEQVTVELQQSLSRLQGLLGVDDTQRSPGSTLTTPIAALSEMSQSEEDTKEEKETFLTKLEYGLRLSSYIMGLGIGIFWVGIILYVGIWCWMNPQAARLLFGGMWESMRERTRAA
ncbi:uncharacterized protein LOC129588982 [Paramacrobiotus metropolitanus]|uniref:uncharacterized protein LOC129588982 n=1 Tax=Paramacrobiotus metropolitanus TaxID=2943436 RepID=UPI0024462D2C|nr:uncharacterized protein LOC129588982 [Paramacrobiotus metropolitanus]